MKHRWLAYLTLLFALLLPLVAVVWGRSYMRNDTLFRIGDGHAMALDCIRGEISFWIAPSRTPGPARYRLETADSEFGMTGAELFALSPVAQAKWFMGFGYIEAPWTPTGVNNATGKTRCFVVPLWFVALLIGSLPARQLLRLMKWSEAVKSPTLCRRCGAELAEGDLRCGQCSFPAMVQNQMVA